MRHTSGSLLSWPARREDRGAQARLGVPPEQTQPCTGQRKQPWVNISPCRIGLRNARSAPEASRSREGGCSGGHGHCGRPRSILLLRDGDTEARGGRDLPWVTVWVAGPAIEGAVSCVLHAPPLGGPVPRVPRPSTPPGFWEAAEGRWASTGLGVRDPDPTSGAAWLHGGTLGCHCLPLGLRLLSFKDLPSPCKLSSVHIQGSGPLIQVLKLRSHWGPARWRA